MAPHSSTLAWKILWMEEPGRLQSVGSLESDTTEQLHLHFSLSCIGEGKGNPLQCSCLENPRDGRAWWAAVYGVTQSRTRLKRLSSYYQATLLLCFSNYSPVQDDRCIQQRPRVFLSKPLDSPVLNWWTENRRFQRAWTASGIHLASSHFTDQKTATQTRLTEREAEKYEKAFSKTTGEMTIKLILVISLECKEILNHYVVYQESTTSHRSIILQKQTNSQKKRSDLWLFQVGGEGD